MLSNNEKGSGGPHKCITCPHCGEQIPMVPVLSDMIQAIENHLTTHQEGYRPKHDPIQQPKVSFISENLAEQVLMRAAEIGETLTREPTINLHPTDTAT